MFKSLMYQAYGLSCTPSAAPSHLLLAIGMDTCDIKRLKAGNQNDPAFYYKVNKLLFNKDIESSEWDFIVLRGGLDNSTIRRLSVELPARNIYRDIIRKSMEGKSMNSYHFQWEVEFDIYKEMK